MNHDIINKSEIDSPKNRIKNQAKLLFAIYGFESVSTREISEKANVNISMISYYFGSKELLLMDLIDDFIYSFNKYSNQINRIADPSEKINLAIQYYFKIYVENWELTYVFLQEQNKCKNNELQDKIDQFKIKTISNFRSIINQDELENKLNNINAENLYCMLIGSINNYLRLPNIKELLLKNDSALKEKNEEFLHFLQLTIKTLILKKTR